MADSLQDQLRALGLARGKPAGKSSGKRRRPERPSGNRTARGKGSQDEMSLEKAYALKQRDERKQADHKRRKKQAEDRQRRLLNKEIRTVVEAARLNSKDAGIARNFMFRGRIRKIHVTPDQLKALNGGELGIAYLSGGYHLLAKKDLEAVRKLSAEHVIELESEVDDDGDHPVPDDLIW